uniref:Pre-mRNA splicing factor component Cdc5p/Cef1 C-terminal domain-containing protein n=1 Tax=Panagrolaimus davidi TaxID=227884 RepID=A0A914Q122_9BILA
MLLFIQLILLHHQTPRTNYEQTPGTVVSATPGATPFRDQLNINKDAERASVEELRQQLKTLPAPKNDFEVVMPEDEVKSDEEDVDMVCNRKSYSIL